MTLDKTTVEHELQKPVADISIIKLVDEFIAYAYLARASDIHIDPSEDRVKLRLRIDGVMHETFIIPKAIHDEVVSRIKVLAEMRMDEHQAAQDGRFRVTIPEGKESVKFDIRVSIAPTYYGENAVLRLLVEQGRNFTLEDVGFSKNDYEKIKKAIKKPYGMILVTGPTGSGKTTTLYTILKTLHTHDVSIITIEDPIEYSLEGVNQIQVNNQTSLSFANGLRSILRQDPNIIMVGEIRDQETANIAVNAALTGHLLLSTIHTNEAATTLPRLFDMKVEPFLIASTVNIAVAQRLVRKICPDCKAKKKFSKEECAALRAELPETVTFDETEFYIGEGCKTCNQTGYLGRVGIYEIMEITDRIRTAITTRASAPEIKKIALEEGMTTVLEDGVRKAVQGVTTLEEVFRVMRE